MTRLQGQLCAALEAHLAGERANPPEAGRLLWNAFNDLSRARSYHGAGPNPIGYAEIHAWCMLMRMPLEPHHVACIVAMDRVWTDHVHQAVRAGSALPAAAPATKRALTPGLFDAVLG